MSDNPLTALEWWMMVIENHPGFFVTLPDDLTPEEIEAAKRITDMPRDEDGQMSDNWNRNILYRGKTVYDACDVTTYGDTIKAFVAGRAIGDPYPGQRGVTMDGTYLEFDGEQWQPADLPPADDIRPFGD